MNKPGFRFAAFALIGLLITLIGIVIVVVLTAITGNPLAANVIGYTCGLILSYVLNSRYTFNRSRTLARALRFFGSFAIALAANLLMVYFVVYRLHAPKTLGSLAGLPVYTACFYLLCEKWAFKA